MHTEGQRHGQAVLQLHTGAQALTRPSMGSWVVYGLGTENQDLPGFVTICPTRSHGGVQNYGNAFLPATYQGTSIGHAGTPASGATIRNLANSKLTLEQQRKQLDLLRQQLSAANLRAAEAASHAAKLRARAVADEELAAQAKSDAAARADEVRRSATIAREAAELAGMPSVFEEIEAGTDARAGRRLLSAAVDSRTAEISAVMRAVAAHEHRASPGKLRHR